MHPRAERSPALDPWPVVLARQGGVIARAQALAGGMSPAAWRWRTSSRWQSPLAGVAVAHTGRLSRVEASWCAVLVSGSGAALSADWALVAQGWQCREPGAVDVAVPAQRHVAARRLLLAGARLDVRPRRVVGLHRLVHPALRPPVVRTAPATLHAAAWAPSDRAAEWRVASVVQQRLTTVPALRDALASLPRLPRRALLRGVLDDVELGAHAQTELDLLAVLRRHGLPEPDRMQLRDRAGGLRYLDAWWERQRVVVEVDGAHHREAGTWEADLLRANAVAVAHLGDRVVLLRVTGGQLRHDEAVVVEQLRAVLL